MISFFIIVGILLILIAVIGLLLIFFSDPARQKRISKRWNNFLKRRETKRQLRETNRRFKELGIQREIREKEKEIKRKEELQGLSDKDIERIQRRGLNYIDRDI